jgi:hypothetical protein
LARPHPALIEIAAGRPVTEVADAPELVRSAFEHKMGGLLSTRVAAGELVLEDQWHQILLRHDVRNWARHTRLKDGLVKVQSQLAEIGVPVATGKGVTAEARWYDRPGERTCFDVDIIISPSDLLRVDDILARLAPDHPLRGAAPQLVAADRLLSMNLDVDGTPVDLHFDMLKLDLLASKQRALLWERRTPFRFADGAAVDVLDAETSLIQLLLQLNKDSFSYLLGFADVARICEREELDWGFIDGFMRAEGIDSHLYSALDVVARTLGIRTPVRPRARGWRAAWWRLVWRPRHRLQGDDGIIRSQRRNWWLPLTARGRTGDAIRALVGRLFPPTPLLSYYYPDTRGPYLWRLLSGRVARQGRQRRLAANIGSLRSARLPRLATRPIDDRKS